ncbi:MAG: dihydrofolate reductase [Comamonas sp.]|nr:dihydrofolate reductase [Candidatus Comamonas equi]
MAIHLIYARAANGVIGLNNTMPWHLPEDLAHFKQLTSGHPVVMGRKTWDSLPERFRPLPGRTNIVVTRNTDWSAPGVVRASSLEQALQLGAQHGETVWVMGGAQIYAQALPLADVVEVTIIDQDFEGDAFAPVLGSEWEESARQDLVSTQGMPFSFVRYTRKR